MDIIQDARQRMGKALDVLKTDLATVRTGRAAPSLIENVVISVYGGSARMRIMELATITTSDSQTLLLTPFDQSIIGEIQKGIMEANVGLTPTIDSQNIRISIPPLSQERREQLIHLMRQKLENGKIMLRQVRHDAMTEVKKQKGNGELSEDECSRLEKEIQKVTDDVVSEIESLGKRKEDELLQV